MNKPEEFLGYSKTIEKYILPIRFVILCGFSYYLLSHLQSVPAYVIAAVFIWTAFNDLLTFIVGVRRGPIRFEFHEKKLIAIMKSGEETKVDIETITEVKEMRWLQILHGYTILVCINDGTRLYIKRDMEGLDRFLKQLIALNPNCRVQGAFLLKKLQVS